MDNKYVLAVMAAIMVTVTYYVAHMPYFANEAGGVADGFWYALILATAMGAGGTGGSDVVSILMEGITGYIGTMITLAIIGAVSEVAIVMGVMGGAFDVGGVISGAVSFAVAGLLINLAASYARKAA